MTAMLFIFMQIEVLAQVALPDSLPWNYMSRDFLDYRLIPKPIQDVYCHPYASTWDYTGFSHVASSQSYPFAELRPAFRPFYNAISKNAGRMFLLTNIKIMNLIQEEGWLPKDSVTVCYSYKGRIVKKKRMAKRIIALEGRKRISRHNMIVNRERHQVIVNIGFRWEKGERMPIAQAPRDTVGQKIIFWDNIDIRLLPELFKKVYYDNLQDTDFSCYDIIEKKKECYLTPFSGNGFIVTNQVIMDMVQEENWSPSETTIFYYYDGKLVTTPEQVMEMIRCKQNHALDRKNNIELDRQRKIIKIGLPVSIFAELIQ